MRILRWMRLAAALWVCAAGMGSAVVKPVIAASGLPSDADRPAPSVVHTTTPVTRTRLSSPMRPNDVLEAEVIALATGGNASHMCVVLADRTVMCWGNNGSTQLGLGDGAASEVYLPEVVGGLADVADISMDVTHSCALLTNGTVKCWGTNSRGKLGDGTNTNRTTPVDVLDPSGTAPLSGVTHIAAGANHTCAATSTNVYCWGWTVGGRLGDGRNDLSIESHLPVTVSGLVSVTSLSAGTDQTCATKVSGEVWCWGSNSYGQLGTNGGGDALVPRQMLAPNGTDVLTDVAEVSASYQYTCVRLNDGRALCSGYNENETLGNGDSSDEYLPVWVQEHGVGTPLTGIAQTSAAAYHSCHRMTDGTARCTDSGNNWWPNVDSSQPYTIFRAENEPLTGIIQISSYSDALCALTNFGVYCLGSGQYGRLGNGGTSNEPYARLIIQAPPDIETFSCGEFECQLEAPLGLQLSAVSTSAAPAGLPRGVTTPLERTAFTVTNATPGGTVLLTMTVPSGARVNGYHQRNRLTSAWVDVAAGVAARAATGTHVEISLTDGGPYDADGAANGVIVAEGVATVNMQAMAARENDRYIGRLAPYSATVNSAAVTYEILSAAPNASMFTVDETTGDLWFAAAPDYESPGTTARDGAGLPVYTVTVRMRGFSSAAQDATETIDVVVRLLDDPGVDGWIQNLAGDVTQYAPNGLAQYVDRGLGSSDYVVIGSDPNESFVGAQLALYQETGNTDSVISFDSDDMSSGGDTRITMDDLFAVDGVDRGVVVADGGATRLVGFMFTDTNALASHASTLAGNLLFTATTGTDRLFSMIMGLPSLETAESAWVWMVEQRNWLDALQVSDGTLTPGFVSGTLNYTLAVPNTTDQLTVTGFARNNAITLTTGTGALGNGASVPLSVGVNVITVTTKPQETTLASRQYVLRVTRAAAAAPTPTRTATATATRTPTPAGPTPTATRTPTRTPTPVGPTATAVPPTSTPTPAISAPFVSPSHGSVNTSTVSIIGPVGSGFTGATGVFVKGVRQFHIVRNDRRVEFTMKPGVAGTTVDVVLVKAGGVVITLTQSYTFEGPTSAVGNISAGAVLTTASGVTITVPPQDALRPASAEVGGSLVITYAPVDQPAAPPGDVPLSFFDVSVTIDDAPAAALAAPATLELPVDAAKVPAGQRPWLYQWMAAGGGWVLAPGQTYDATSGRVTARVTEMGRYALSTLLLQQYWLPMVPPLR